MSFNVEQMKLALTLLTCQPYKTKLNFCYRTWLNQFTPDQTYIFSSENSNIGLYNIISTTLDDSVHNQSIKYFNGLFGIDCVYDIYVIAQLDYFINKKRLLSFVSSISLSEPFIGGYMMPFSGGPIDCPRFDIVNTSVIMNRLFVELLRLYVTNVNLNTLYFNKFRYDGHAIDVLLGYFCVKLNVLPTNLSKYMMNCIQFGDIAYNFIHYDIIDEQLYLKISIHLHSYYLLNRSLHIYMQKFMKLLDK